MNGPGWARLRLSAALVTLLLARLSAASPGDVVDFNRDVRPLLADRCYSCHGPDADQRKAGLRLDQRDVATAVLSSGRVAVVPGDPSASELWRRVTHPDPSERMPPARTGKPLSDSDRETLRAWVESGAPFARHWSFRPPERSATTEDEAHPIDALVASRLAREGWSLADEATRERLIRRVTFDLTGLPPTVEEVDAFLADDRGDAYERLVDRLLLSPRYGEHFARDWLDVARYGDTHGFHLDNVRSLWPWRDYVIRAFNDNMPFDRFVVEQLAGDLLPEPSRDQLVATGFNRCNPTTGEGGLIVEEYLAKYAMDRVDTFSTVFLGLTVHCAQCHDHKYDPISQREYYELFAFFNNIAEQGSDENALAPPPSLRVPSAADEAALAGLADRVGEIESRMAAPMPEVDAAQRTWEVEWRERLAGRFHDVETRSALSLGGARAEVLDDGSVRFGGDNPDRDVYEIVAATRETGIIALRLDLLAEPAAGGVGRASHHNIVLTGVEVEAASLADPLRTRPVPIASAAADHAQRDFSILKAIDDDPQSGYAIAGGEREDRSLVLALAEPIGAPGGTVLRVRLRQESVYRQHNIARLRVAVSSDPAALPASWSSWWVAGPFAVPDGPSGLREALGPEAAPFDPSASFADGAIGWQRRDDFHDEAVLALDGEVAVTYLHRTISAPSPRSVTLGIGSDDGVRVWLNGELVLDRDVARPVAPDQDRLTLSLREGDNDLLVKVANYGGGFAYYQRIIGEAVDGLPSGVARALTAADADRDPVQVATLRDYYRELHADEWRALRAERDALAAERVKVEAAVPVTMIAREREERRPAHVLIRGRYDRPGDEVSPGVPAALPPLPEGPADRLALARWLVDPRHPLTARVFVNRLWQRLFGVGLVKTAEDFGAQGEWPSHPELLDWLAVEFVDSGFDVKHMVRLLTTSATYRQRARVDAEVLARDPGNRLLARGPRHRLDAEMIRDAALFNSGLLVEQLGGPSVKPYQPPGIWFAVGYTTSNTARFQRDDGDALYRRSLYTFWKRTAPPPTLQMLDAPSREACTVRRARTNTPLQALALLNDEQFVEAARVFAERILARDDGEIDRVVYAFRTVTSRTPGPVEVSLLCALLDEQRAAFDVSPESARRLLEVGEAPVDEHAPARERYAWTCLANALFNLDEAITRG